MMLVPYGYTFGRIGGSGEDADNDTGKDAEEGAPAPRPTTASTTQTGPTTLTTTGADILLLAVLGLVALGGGLVAVTGGRRSARRKG
jgi:hypothetical protein